MSTIPAVQSPDLLDLEKSLEIDAVSRGVERYRELEQKRHRQPASTRTPEQRLLLEAFSPLEQFITRLQEETRGLTRTRGVSMQKQHIGYTQWGRPLRSLPAEKLALITLSVCINHLDKRGGTLTTIALRIADEVRTEIHFDTLRGGPWLDDRTAAYNQMTPKQRWRHKQRARAEIKWSRNVCVQLGSILVHAALDSTGIFEKVRSNRKDRPAQLRLTPRAQEELRRQRTACELLHPQYLPMVVPPRNWSPTQQGGHLHHSYPLVKRAGKQRQQASMPEVYAAINHLQSTPWRINRHLHVVLMRLLDANRFVKGLPEPERQVPPPPSDFGEPNSTKRWRGEAAAVHLLNEQVRHDQTSLRLKLQVATKFLDSDPIYFPYDIDSRGRIYPKVTALHPQADDVGRALLEFSRSKPLGRRGFYWLCVHAANSWGQVAGKHPGEFLDTKKLDFETRVGLILDNLQELHAWTEDPISHFGWSDAEHPFKLLAAAYEIVAAVDHAGTLPVSRDVVGFAADYASRLPVSVDGSCNGLQHLSALGRDAEGGMATNLVPGTVPQDIYDLVAGLVSDHTDACTHGDNPLGFLSCPCSLWRGRITRDTVKPAVMCLPYGMTRQGMQRALVRKEHAVRIGGNPWTNARYLQELTSDVVAREIAAGARALTDWLRDVARLAGKRNVSIHWTTPVGLVMAREYRQEKKHVVHTPGQKHVLWASPSDAQVNVAKQGRALPANFVHSLDAAHLMLTVNRCFEAGIDSFEPVHDSFATHACDIDLLNRILREEFVKMHSQPILQGFITEVEAQCGFELPPLPPRGSLDLQQVKDSRYFFH